jgi:hypothetical protein
MSRQTDFLRTLNLNSGRPNRPMESLEMTINRGRYGELTVKELTNYRTDLVRLIEGQRLKTDQGRAFYDYVLGAGRKVETLQEMVRIGKEMVVTLSLTGGTRNLPITPLELVTNLQFAHWVVTNDIKSLRDYFATAAVCEQDKQYRECLLALEEDKLINPQRYSLV